MTLRCAKRKIVLDLGMSTLKEESAHWAGLAGAKNNTRGVLDRPGTQLLRLRPTLSPQAVGKGSAAWSSAPWSRLIGCSLLLFLWRPAVCHRDLRRRMNMPPTDPQS